MPYEYFKSNISKRSYQFALKLIQFIGSFNNKSYTNQIIFNQLIRCGTSIGANISEAQGSSSKREFKNFLNHSLKSANESVFWLYLLKDSQIADHLKVEGLLVEAKEIANILASSLITLKEKRNLKY